MNRLIVLTLLGLAGIAIGALLTVAVARLATPQVSAIDPVLLEAHHAVRRP